MYQKGASKKVSPERCTEKKLPEKSISVPKKYKKFKIFIVWGDTKLERVDVTIHQKNMEKSQIVLNAKLGFLFGGIWWLLFLDLLLWGCNAPALEYKMSLH